MIKNTLMNKDTQRQIAEKIGISEGMVSLMFAGKRQPSIKVAKRRRSDGNKIILLWVILR